MSDTEMNNLITAGISVFGNNSARNGIILSTTVTTYKTDSAGDADDSFKYLEYVDTMSQSREYFYNNLRAQYAQSRLTEGDVIPNCNMANAASISAYLDGIYNDLSGQDYVLLQAGSTALTYFKQNRVVVLDLETGLVTVTAELPIVTQLRSIVMTMQLSFSTNG
jgi:phage tail sheath gpL-like